MSETCIHTTHCTHDLPNILHLIQRNRQLAYGPGESSSNAAVLETTTEHHSDNIFTLRRR